MFRAGPDTPPSLSLFKGPPPLVHSFPLPASTVAKFFLFHCHSFCLPLRFLPIIIRRIQAPVSPPIKCQPRLFFPWFVEQSTHHIPTALLIDLCLFEFIDPFILPSPQGSNGLPLAPIGFYVSDLLPSPRRRISVYDFHDKYLFNHHPLPYFADSIVHAAFFLVDPSSVPVVGFFLFFSFQSKSSCRRILRLR